MDSSVMMRRFRSSIWKCLRQSQQATSIPHYWRDRDGKVSQFWHSGVIPKGTGVVCQHRERGMKHTFWTVTDPESELDRQDVYRRSHVQGSQGRLSLRSLNTQTFHLR